MLISMISRHAQDVLMISVLIGAGLMLVGIIFGKVLGAQGTIGPVGPVGETGVPGPGGPTGAMGIQGPVGRCGVCKFLTCVCPAETLEKEI